MGSGIPRGRFIEVVGDPSTTKSAFGLLCIAAFQRVGGVGIILDTEHKIEKSWAIHQGVDWDNLGYETPKDIMETGKILSRVGQIATPQVPVLVDWDSIAQTPEPKELENSLSKDGMKTQPGSHAKAMSGLLRVTLMELARKNVTFIGINQLRTFFNFFGASWKDSPGGMGVKYGTAMRLAFRTPGKIKPDVEHDVVTGVEVTVEAIKNQCSMPFRKANLKFKFDKGFDPWYGLDGLLLRHNRVTEAAGWMRYRDRKFRKAELSVVAMDEKGILEPLDAIEQNPTTLGSDSETNPLEMHDGQTSSAQA